MIRVVIPMMMLMLMIPLFSCPPDPQWQPTLRCWQDTEQFVMNLSIIVIILIIICCHTYLYVICVIRCLIECDPLYSVPWPVHMHCHHPILSYSLSSKLLSSPILDHQIITNHPLHSVHDLFTFIVTILVISSSQCSVSSKLLSSSNHHKFTSVSDLDLQRTRSLVP